MTDEPGQKLSEEELDRLARELFAEVRGEYTEAKVDRALKTAGEVAGEVLPGIPDWLLDGSDDAGEGDSGD
ncbi:hypothetical protein ACU4GR_29655 [Methylobacterium oryzae CBMB20]